MIDLFTTLTNKFHLFMEFAGTNPVIGGVVSLWGLGIVTFLLRNVPQTIGTFLKKQLTVTLTITSGDKTFRNFCQWYEESNYAKNSRLIATFDNVQSMGYGSQWILHKMKPIHMKTSKIENMHNVRVEVELTTFGRSRTVFDQMLKDISEVGHKGPKVSFWDGYWNTLGNKPSRPSKTLFLPSTDKSKLFDLVDNFVNNENFYTDRGLNYKLNILLYGPPGTGKSTIALVIASKFKKNLNILPLSDISDVTLINAYSSVNSEDIILIEDVDACAAACKRDVDDFKNDGNGATTSGLLNVLDGVLSAPGVITILTTNHLDKLDPAIIRPGRMDLVLEIGYARREEISEMFKMYYPGFKIDDKLKFKSNMPMSFVQEAIIGNLEEPQKALSLLLEA